METAIFIPAVKKNVAFADDLVKKLADKTGRLARLGAGEGTLDQSVRQLYLATFSRLPSDAEVATCREVVDQSEDRRKGLQNVLWALCNSREFLFNH